MKKKKLGILVALLLVVGAGVYTYARYTTSFEGSGTVDVAKWSVSVNGYDAEEEKFALTLAGKTNDYVASGKIAPGVSAEGTIVLDLSDTEVDTEYTVAIGDIDDLPAGFEITSIVAKNGEEETTLNDGNDFTGVITHEEIATNPEVQLVITVTWTNDEVNNTTDTEVGVAGEALVIPVTVTAKQHIG